MPTCPLDVDGFLGVDVEPVGGGARQAGLQITAPAITLVTGRHTQRVLIAEGGALCGARFVNHPSVISTLTPAADQSCGGNDVEVAKVLGG